MYSCLQYAKEEYLRCLQVLPAPKEEYRIFGLAGAKELELCDLSLPVSFAWRNVVVPFDV